MTVLNVHGAKTRLSAVLAEVERGGEVVIARNNRPIAKLVAIKPEPRTFGLRSFRVPDDFDAPLSSQELSMWE